jgi:hypothetical protein
MPQVSAVFRGFFIRIGCFHQPQERMPLRGVVTWVTCEGLQISDLTFQDGCSLIYSVLPLLTLIGLLLLTWRFRNSGRLDQYIIFYDQRLVPEPHIQSKIYPSKLACEVSDHKSAPQDSSSLAKRYLSGVVSVHWA